MSYTPLYTSEVKVEGELQIDIDATSNPSSAELLVWIEEVEDEINQEGLGSLTATDVMLDVPEEREKELPPYGTLAWFEELVAPAGNRRILKAGKIVIPELRPIISVTSVSRRTSGLGDTEDWDSLTEGLSNDYIVLKKRIKGMLRGYAFYFFNNIPASGVQRLKATYTYGLNLDTSILSQYATWKVALRVLMALSQTADPSSLTQFVGGDLQTYVPVQYAQKIEQLQGWIAEWREKWVDKPIAVGVL